MKSCPQMDKCEVSTQVLSLSSAFTDSVYCNLPYLQILGIKNYLRMCDPSGQGVHSLHAQLLALLCPHSQAAPTSHSHRATWAGCGPVSPGPSRTCPPSPPASSSPCWEGGCAYLLSDLVQFGRQMVAGSQGHRVSLVKGEDGG